MRCGDELPYCIGRITGGQCHSNSLGSGTLSRVIPWESGRRSGKILNMLKHSDSPTLLPFATVCASGTFWRTQPCWSQYTTPPVFRFGLQQIVMLSRWWTGQDCRDCLQKTREKTWRSAEENLKRIWLQNVSIAHTSENLIYHRCLWNVNNHHNPPHCDTLWSIIKMKKWYIRESDIRRSYISSEMR